MITKEDYKRYFEMGSTNNIYAVFYLACIYDNSEYALEEDEHIALTNLALDVWIGNDICDGFDNVAYAACLALKKTPSLLTLPYKNQLKVVEGRYYEMFC